LLGGAALRLWIQLSSDERYGEQFCARVPGSCPREEQQASLMLAIPFLAWAVSGYSFPVICKALETDLFREVDAQRWLQTYMAKKTYVCRAPKNNCPTPVKRSRKRKNRKRSRLVNNLQSQPGNCHSETSTINVSYPSETRSIAFQGPEASLISHPRIHRLSESLFHRYPFKLPYESQIFVLVQSGDVAAVRAHCQNDPAIIDVIDPYGLGLLYVRYLLTFASGWLRLLIILHLSTVHTTAGGTVV
jgi:hypothetical protein